MSATSTTPVPETGANRANTPALFPVVPDVWGLRNVFVNLYYVRNQATTTPGWVLIDAGLPGAGKKVQHQAEYLFGAGVAPAAILLTHGHFDHVGALGHLLETWPHVPVYAHPLELPYLTGLSSYPPPDPTVGRGAMAAMSFLYPKKPIDIRERVQALPTDGSVPGLPGWRWVATPGHTPGHVSFFREKDQLLIAGDAFVTVSAESGLATIAQSQEVSGPPAYFTPDWPQSYQSVLQLSELKPAIAATGHGIPMRGAELQRQLEQLVSHFQEVAVPAQGRYVGQSARANALGVTYVPPAPERKLPGWALGAGAALVAGIIWYRNRQTNSVSSGSDMSDYPSYSDRRR